MTGRPIIGVAGGIGPHAGLDLVSRIYAATRVVREQDHLDVVLASFPARVPDRTAFLEGTEARNPAEGILDTLERCYRAGARLLAIACNTAHALPIFEPILAGMAARMADAKLVGLVDVVVEHLADTAPREGAVGVLATSGTVGADVYGASLRARGIEVLYPTGGAQRDLVHAAIYDSAVGIKPTGAGVHADPRRRLLQAGAELVDRGATRLVLACTEIGLVVGPGDFGSVPVVDSSTSLARELVRLVDPDRLAAPPAPRAGPGHS